VTMFYLLKREIPWEEAFSIPLAFALYYVGYALLGYQTRAALNWLDWLGIALFVIGSFTNTFSELQRDAWKKDPAHKGQIYTSGLFRYSMHVNFFGDLVWVIGYAILTRNLYAIIIPILLFSLFAFYNIPALDKHLAEHYGQQFSEYSHKTKKFIPFLY
jgi:steroid 5-alpha reductase family enzyme